MIKYMLKLGNQSFMPECSWPKGRFARASHAIHAFMLPEGAAWSGMEVKPIFHFS